VLQVQVKNLVEAFNTNVGVYANIFAGVEAVQRVVQNVLDIVARGEKPQMVTPEGSTEAHVDFPFYLRQYQEEMAKRQEEEAVRKAAAEAPPPPTAAEANEAPAVFGGTGG
jgi:hypothetical protein